MARNRRPPPNTPPRRTYFSIYREAFFRFFFFFSSLKILERNSGTFCSTVNQIASSNPGAVTGRRV